MNELLFIVMSGRYVAEVHKMWTAPCLVTTDISQAIDVARSCPRMETRIVHMFKNGQYIPNEFVNDIVSRDDVVYAVDNMGEQPLVLNNLHRVPVCVTPSVN